VISKVLLQVLNGIFNACFCKRKNAEEIKQEKPSQHKRERATAMCEGPVQTKSKLTMMFHLDSYA